ncbi:MAG: hypothetical protein J7K53_05035, partial [Bacteroidales bacterium]|nr:hypothetical protein [Bacteroidales bacterium]
SLSSYVHIPEEWERDYEDRQSKRSIIGTIGSVFSIILLIAGMIWGIVRWTRKEFSVKLFLYFAIGLLGIFILDSYLTWDSVMFGYQTSLPWSNFVTMFIVSLGIAGLFSSAGLGIIGGMSVKLVPAKVSDRYNWLKAIGLGLALFGLNALLSKFEIKTSPFWANFDAANSRLPLVSTGIGNIQSFIGITGVLLILYFGLHTFTKKWTQSKWLFGGLIVLAGILIQAASLDNYIFWIVSGLLVGFVLLGLYILFIRYHFEWIPIIAAVSVILGIVSNILIGAVPSALSGGILGIIIIGLFTWWWYFEFVHTHNAK